MRRFLVSVAATGAGLLVMSLCVYILIQVVSSPHEPPLEVRHAEARDRVDKICDRDLAVETSEHVVHRDPHARHAAW